MEYLRVIVGVEASSNWLFSVVFSCFLLFSGVLCMFGSSNWYFSVLLRYLAYFCVILCNLNSRVKRVYVACRKKISW